MYFKKPDDFLKILLSTELLYDEILEISQEYLQEIKVHHQSLNGNIYPSAISQCILECFKIKNSFKSSVWVSNKHINKDIVRENQKPIKFSRMISNNNVVEYEMYNLDQLNITDTDESFEDKNIKEITVCNEKFLKGILLWISTNEKIHTERDLIIYKSRYGLNDGNIKTLEEIGRNYNISKERVRQLINRITMIINRKCNYANKKNIDNVFLKLYKQLKCVEKKLEDNSVDDMVSESYLRELIKEEFQNDNLMFLDLINRLLGRDFGIKKEQVERLSEKDIKNGEIKKAILACISEFRGQYGRTGIAKILKGSESIKDNAYNNLTLNSKYYGMCKQLTLSFIINEIDNLLEEEILITNKVNFGRPVIGINPKISEEEILRHIYEEKSIESDDIDDENIKRILKLINNKENIFITGHAGTGKSYILSKLKEMLPYIVITSTTGIAAVNVKGQTLHSWAGIGICNCSVEHTVEKILKKTNIRNQIQKCKILAIDEISMLDNITLEYVDAVFKKIRDNDKPFGGIQVIFIGDFFQLPPVEKEKSDTVERYCFESQIWRDLELKTIMLTKNYRQSEENLITALSNMRTNSLTNEDIKLLKTREIYDNSDMSDILHIFSTNIEADNYNSFNFKKINSQEYVLYAIDGIYKGQKFVENPISEKDNNILKRIDVLCRAEKSISLKVNARVMLLINLDFDKGLINGSCGNVREIDENYVIVDFDNGVKSKITRHDFEFYNNDVLIAMRKQFPLRLAYAVTIHKSQGMSLDKLYVDCSRIFEKGQAYVALSRIKTLNGLYLRNFNPTKVMVDNKVVSFYESLKY